MHPTRFLAKELINLARIFLLNCCLEALCVVTAEYNVVLGGEARSLIILNTVYQ